MTRARFQWTGAPLVGAVRQAAARGLLLGAEHVLQVSRTQVPIDEATLERSGTASVDSSSLTAAISYDTPYAVRQHEEMTYRHAAGRKAKYLEDPMREEADQVGEIIATQIRRALQ